MAVIDITNPSASTFAKDVYLPGFNYELENEQGTMLALLGLDPDAAVQLEGRRQILKLKVGDSLGQGTIGQGAEFATPGDITSAEAILDLARITHSVQLDSWEIGLLDSMDAAAAPVIEEKLASAKNAMLRDIIRQSWGDGTGVLARVGSVSGTDITLSSTAGNYYDDNRFVWIDDANRYRYDIVDSTTGAQEVTGFTISNVNETTNVCAASATVTAAEANDYIVRSGVWASGGAFTSLEFPGIMSMVDDANIYLNVNRATAGNGWWKATVLSNSGTARNLTNNLIHTLLNRMARRLDNGKQPSAPDHIAFANFPVWSFYHELMAPGLRYTTGEKPDIGWGDPIPMMGIPLYKDIHAPRRQIVVLHKPSIKFCTAKHNRGGGIMSFVERNGSIFFQVPGTNAYKDMVHAYMAGFLGMFTTRPRNHGRLADLTEIAA